MTLIKRYTHYFIYALSLAAILSSCANNQKQQISSPTTADSINATTPQQNSSDAFQDLERMSDNADQITNLQQQLSTLTPIVKDSIKQVLPSSLLELPRQQFSVKSNPIFGNLLTGKATYWQQIDRQLQLTIIDGAGKTGSAFVTMAIWNLRSDFSEQTDSGFTKSTSFNGHRTKLAQDSIENTLNSQLIFAYKNRFLITLKGENYTAEDLKIAAKSLDLSPLDL